MKRRCFFLCVFLALTLEGCQQPVHPDQTAAAGSGAKVYPLRGKVVATNAATGEVTLNHEAIQGFMDAMVMPYKLRDPSVLSELHPGDMITADVLVTQGADESVVLDHIVVIAQGRPDYRPKVLFHVPAPGDEVPDFALRNQDNKPIHVAQFKGRELLVTFIYTRCPLPDFCPRMTRNFADIDKKLEADPGLHGKVHLLSVSFDPEHDTPQRLRAFGAQYIGNDAPEAFRNWDLAVPARPELTKMAQYFDLGVTEDADHSITHTLSTTLIGRDGKVIQFYPGNEWTPDQVMRDMRQAAGR